MSLFHYVLCFIILLGCNSNEVTYHKDVKKIIKNSCLRCHAKWGSAAYFSLDSFEDLKKNAKSITKWVRDKKMPPHNAKSDGIDFINPEYLPDEDRKKLLAFLREPIIGKKPDNTTVSLLKKDHDLKITHLKGFSKGLKIPTRGFVHKCYFVDIPDELEGRYITNLHMDLSKIQFMHHILVHIVKVKNKQELDQYRDDYTGCSYPEKNLLPIFTKDVGFKIKKGSNFIVKIHFDRTMDENLKDYKAINDIQFTLETKSRVKYSPISLRFDTPYEDIFIPYGTRKKITKFVSIQELIDIKRKRTKEQEVFNEKIFGLVSIFIHMHSAGVKGKIEKISHGKTRVILEEENFDTAHQFAALPRKPVKIGLTDKIKITCEYDNTMMNPYMILLNKDKNNIRGGPSAQDEMCIIMFALIKLKKEDDFY